ncbi:16S rRNA (uracil(1498)-N(3))-methyltransferase [Chungangia koreensis]|uniref:Ribosomal RNA small subunit methyltransferase E n=1 Tax=Chungangia koreensis TaxID=752657 RepID=A0ABV8X6N1_9LACT
MQRYFINGPLLEDGSVEISGEDAKHISRVLRMGVGDRVIVVISQRSFIAEITTITDQSVIVVPESNELRNNEMPIRVAIACGLPKGEKLEWIAQKATELGMNELIPFKAERSIVKWDDKKGAKKQERLQKIAKEAAEQSHRSIIPEVHEPISLKQLIDMSSQFDVLYVADEEDAKAITRTRFAEQMKSVYDKLSMMVVFGPEGGLSRNEAEVLKEAGFKTISLGPRILRTETAPLYVLSAISYEFE